MDAKKLQQLQQAQHLQKKIPLAYQTNIADYRTTTHSPVFQQQQHGNYHLGHVAAAHQQQYQQSPTTTSSSGPLTPIDIQPHASKLLLKHQLQSSGSGGSSAHSSPYHQASTSSGYPTSSTGGTGGTEQLYQSPTERTYLAAAGRINSGHNQASNLQLQYQQLQQAKLQAQLATQNEAAQNQQRQFALRQMINPPVPQGHYHMSQSSSMMSTLTQQQQQQQQPNQSHQQQQQQQQQRAPPSSLNLTNQFQPAAGPLKVTQQNAHKSAQHYHQQQQQQQQQEQIYGQHQHQQLQMQLHHQQQLQQHHHALQQRSKSDLQTPQSSDQSPIYIQQNHPGHVVNQAVQTQISTVAKTSSNPPQITKTPSSEESSSASAKSPTHAPLDRKKSGGGTISNSQALKSPITKRPPNSPVTISGWLYKQGSDGLKVWRKRWFVLAEYCLYYYKGPEEEKVLGSILLPSYKVSACLPEDKIYRKYAFKCEHQNMRTYWLAAENAESMVQWVRALSAATMMQAPSSAGESSGHPSGTSSLNHSGENSDSGIHTLQSQQSKMSGQGQVTPASDNGGVTTSSSSGAGGSVQPLYANAPPKPRRITDGGYSSPSPEHSIDNERVRQHQLHHQQQQQQTSRRSGIMSPTLQQMQQYHQKQQQQHSRSQHHAIYDTRTGNVSSAMRMPQQQQTNYPIDSLEAQYQQQLTLSPDEYPQSPSAQYMDAQMEQQIMQLQQQRVAVDDIYGERELYMQRLIQQRYPPHMAAYVSATERRTPDAYGRSKNRVFSDYEDIYNLTAGAGNTSAQEALMQEAASYRRPLSPPSYESNKHVPSSMTSRFTPNNLESSPVHNAAGSNMNLRARPGAAVVRPHSADFLEYEARAEAVADAAAIAATASMIKPDPVRAPRPKSSLDINRTPDSFYYSEENYAEKMRKSALYLQNPQAQPQQAGSYRTTSGSTDFLSPVASGMNTIGYENPYERTFKRNEMLQDALGNQAGHTSIPRMSRSQTMGNGSQIRSSSTHPHHSLSPPSQQQQNQQEQLQLGQSPAYQQKQTSQSSLLSSGLTTQQIIQQNEQFLRSASARLPKRSSAFDDEPLSAATTSTPINTTITTVTSPPTGKNSPSTSAGGAGGLTQTTPTSHLDGERKREESMKRLLEWKQRMLQSPLTRKGAQHSTSSVTQSGQTISATSNMSAMSKLGSNPNILLASTAVASGAHYPNTVTTTKGGISSTPNTAGGIQRSRSETHANTGPTAGYNSYSSDDEASISVRNVRNLPKGNLTVKPDPSDPQLQEELYQQQQQYNYDQMQKLENSYYGTTHDMKYAKTTLLTDRNTNASSNAATNEALLTGGGGGVTYSTSTPLRRSSNSGGAGTMGQDFYGTSGNIYDMHNSYQQQQHLQHLQQQQQQLLSHPMRRVGSRAEIDMLERETSTQIRNLDVSAGDLLSRTHEELVLLLIQLRRQNSNTARAIEQCCTDIHDAQNRLRTAEGLTRAESIQRLDYLKQHLLDLERQYEKSKPLVNLVDNMVKLGSLYRNDANGRTQRPEAVTLDRLEFNQRIQEKRLLQEEQKQWDRLNPDHSELQSKVCQLYHLDQLLQEESGTLQNLQRDKEDLERALGGLKARIQDTSGPPLALEAAKKQQIMLERELSRVHQLLAENSKKLEQTVAGNARLEQELLMLRQKLQASRGSQSALQISDTYTSNTTAMLESELKRVQTLVGDMQRQRQELSSAVKQLTENSNRLYQEIGNKEHGSLRNGVSGSNNGSIKKRTNSGCWIETDLDTMVCVNRTLSDSTMNLSTPLYVDTSLNNTSGNLLNCSSTSSKLSDYNTGDSMTNESQRRVGSSSNRYNDSSDNLETSGVDSDGFLETNPFANLTQQEKQEIKTVRIVKRESERRHRDRSERSGLSNSTQNLDQVAEEEQYNLMNGSSNMGMGGNYHAKEYQTNERSKSLPRTYTEPPKSSSRHHHRHKHGSSHHNSASTSLSSTNPNYNDYYGHNGASNAYDKNSNYSSQHHQQQQQQQQSQHNHQHQLTNGHGNSQHREHLNPLANAYFAKQMQQQKQQISHNHQNSSSSHSRHSFQSSLRQKTESVQSLNKSLSDLTPSFQSEAARQIMNEMSAGSASEDTEKVQEKVPSQHKHRRAVPKEKRRHYTAPNNVVPVKTIENGQTENDMNRNNTNWRARDDLDMEVALRPRMNAPDVVRSALRHGEKISENTIDNLLLAPNKIVIPERYIPETTPELSPEEKKRRQEKVESIKKMLSEAPISAANETTATLPPSKINEEKKQREHLLQLNQILAQQVMQMSKIVAGNPHSQTNPK